MSRRVMFTAAPGAGHVFPMIPLAWALRAAGHEVLLVTGGRGLAAAAKSGLPFADYAPTMTEQEVSDHITRRFPAHLPSPASRIRNLTEAAERVCHIARFGVDETVRIAGHWRPDLVVHDPLNVAGLICGARFHVPTVQHLWGFVRAAGLSAELHRLLGDDFERNGAAGLPESTTVLDVAPPGMLIGEPEGWPVRYVPHNGAGALPDWLLGSAPARRPRIAVTLGTEVSAGPGLGIFARIAEAAEDVDADFVFAIGADPAQLGALPPNVRAERWLPFAALLARCSAALHHGGAGTTMTTLAAGLPQLLLPSGADHFANGTAVADRGAGLIAEVTDIDPRLLTRLVEDDELRENAAQVRAEITAMPTPAALAARLRTVCG